MDILWLTKLLLSHLLTDFIFQPKSWIEDRTKRKFRSPWLYLHTLLTALVALALIGWQYWLVALIIFITHTLIDGWKSYQKDEPRFFLIDQALHIAVILGCWWLSFHHFADLVVHWKKIRDDARVWAVLTAFVFITWPSSFLIGQLTKKWRLQLVNAEALESAGKWIGIMERSIILVLVLQHQYEAIGLLIAAKGLIRFNETGRTEQKTEYLLIGTLISISIAVLLGLAILPLMPKA
jgi:hypothetical protein